MLIGESNPFCGDRVEEVNTRISSSREVLVVEVPLGGMKMHYEMIPLIQIKNWFLLRILISCL
jgi:hypothetical protein